LSLGIPCYCLVSRHLAVASNLTDVGPRQSPCRHSIEIEAAPALHVPRCQELRTLGTSSAATTSCLVG